MPPKKLTLQSVTFTKKWRCFPKGTYIDFRPGVNLLVGDQGTGKSSLLAALTDKKLRHRNNINLIGNPKVSFKFLDTEKHNPRHATEIKYRIDVVCRFMSHGEIMLPLLYEVGKFKNDHLIFIDEPEGL